MHHLGQHGTKAVVETQQVDLDVTGEQVTVPRCRVHLLPEAGVVDDHVDRADLVADFCGRRVEGRAVGHVDGDDGHPARGDGVELVLATSGDRHSGAAVREVRWRARRRCRSTLRRPRCSARRGGARRSRQTPSSLTWCGRSTTGRPRNHSRMPCSADQRRDPLRHQSAAGARTRRSSWWSPVSVCRRSWRRTRCAALRRSAIVTLDVVVGECEPHRVAHPYTSLNGDT